MLFKYYMEVLSGVKLFIHHNGSRSEIPAATWLVFMLVCTQISNRYVIVSTCYLIWHLCAVAIALRCVLR